jgi:hypothetical protein
MSRLLEVPVQEGGSILIEVDESPNGPALRGRGRAAAPSTEVLEDILAGLGPATRAVLAQLRALADAPHEIEVEFGVKISAEASVIIARAGTEANFRVALKWTDSGR